MVQNANFIERKLINLAENIVCCKFLTVFNSHVKAVCTINEMLMKENIKTLSLDNLALLIFFSSGGQLIDIALGV